jgi:hypothetical protein
MQHPLFQALLALSLVATTLASPAPESRKDVLLSGIDQLALPGRWVKLTAKLEQDGFGKEETPEPDSGPLSSKIWRRDIPGRLVHFFYQESEVGTEVTNKDGEAHLLWKPPGVGDFQLVARFEGDDKFSPGTGSMVCGVRPPGRPTLILDIDHTISNASTWQIIRGDIEAPPLPDAVEVVKELAEHFDIVYVTARINKFQAYTRAWLDHHGFPRSAIFFLDLKKYPTYNEAKYKIATIHPIKALFTGLTLGIGDKESDAKAYRHHALRALILGDTGEVQGAEHVESWLEIREILLGTKASGFRQLHRSLR